MKRKQQETKRVATSSPGRAAHYEERLQHYRRVATGFLFTVASRKAGGVYDELELVCPFNHRFTLTGKDLMRGTGCPACRDAAMEGFRVRQLEDAQRLAIERGGKCLAETFVNARKRLPWQCHKGHHWQATLDNVRRGHWCYYCARGLPRPGRRKGAKKRR